MTVSFFERPILNLPYDIPRLTVPWTRTAKDGPRMLINVEPLKAYYASLPVKVLRSPTRGGAATRPPFPPLDVELAKPPARPHLLRHHMEGAK
jgi:hypothetical protein